MSNLDDFLNDDLSEKKEDQLMKNFVAKRMDAKRKDYESKLKRMHGVTKVDSKPKSKYKRLVAVIVAVVIIGIAYFIVKPRMEGMKADRSAVPIAAYIIDNKVPIYATIRGEGRNDGLDAYLQNRYGDAISYFEGNEMDQRDSFYLAMSYMYENQWNDSKEMLQNLGASLEMEDRFYPEVELYTVILMQLLDQEEEASRIVGTWPRDSWMWLEYQEIDTSQE